MKKNNLIFLLQAALELIFSVKFSHNLHIAKHLISDECECQVKVETFPLLFLCQSVGCFPTQHNNLHNRKQKGCCFTPPDMECEFTHRGSVSYGNTKPPNNKKIRELQESVSWKMTLKVSSSSLSSSPCSESFLFLITEAEILNDLGDSAQSNALHSLKQPQAVVH